MLLEDGEAASGAQLLKVAGGDSDFADHVTFEDHGVADFAEEVSAKLVAVLEDDDVGRGSGPFLLCRDGQVEDASTQQARHHEAPETSRTDMRRYLIGAHPSKIAGWPIFATALSSLTGRAPWEWASVGNRTHLEGRNHKSC